MIRLSVNVDHVATVRQARRTYEPDPVAAAALALLGGADGITVHLREDRRHIQDRDVELLRQTVPMGLNLEMACAPEILAIACRLKPDEVTLVPEKRQELTTEGGLDVRGQRAILTAAIAQLRASDIPVSLFIDPDVATVELSQQLGAHAVEFHTGTYADTRREQQHRELAKLQQAAARAVELGLMIHMGHGLNYHNVAAIAHIPGVWEFNIGHSIVSRAVLVGMTQAVRDMKAAMRA